MDTAIPLTDAREQRLRRVVREPEAASYCGLSAITFRRLRKAGTGPRAIALGTRTWGYRLLELDRWLESRATGGRAG